MLRPAQILIGWSIAFNLKCSSVALYASCIVDSTLLTAAMWLLRTYGQVAIASLIVVISNTRNVSILFLLPLLYLDWCYSVHFSSKFCHHWLTELGIYLSSLVDIADSVYSRYLSWLDRVAANTAFCRHIH